jgi:hypothetical protein
MPTGIVLSHARVTATNVVTVTLHNYTAAGIAMASGNWVATVTGY